MPVINVLNKKAETVSQVDLPDNIYNVDVNDSVLHEIVNMQLATKRAGSASVKNRSDIRGSRRKLFRQKGTGRARRGDIKSPLLRGGGVAFGPKPKDWGYKVPKKKKQLALKMALSTKLNEKALCILSDMDLDEPRTRQFVRILDGLKIKKALIVLDKDNEMLNLSSRNVQGVKVMRHEGLNVYDILKHDHLILLEKSLEGIEGRLQA